MEFVKMKGQLSIFEKFRDNYQTLKIDLTYFKLFSAQIEVQLYILKEKNWGGSKSKTDNNQTLKMSDQSWPNDYAFFQFELWSPRTRGGAAHCVR